MRRCRRCNDPISPTKRSDAIYCSVRCRRENNRNREQDLESDRRSSLRIRYGITLSDYDELMESQDGVCAICGDEDPTGIRLAVDHCHDTGEVRGLLCGPCNRGIGMLKDDPHLLANAIAYLT